MNTEHRKTILRNIGQLVERTDLEALLPKLAEKGVLLDFMLQKYKPEKWKRDMDANLKRELYLEIQTRGPTAFQNLVSALHESDHNDLAILLEPEAKLIAPPASRKSSHPFHLPNYLANHEAVKSMKNFAESHPHCKVNLGTEPITIHVKKASKVMDSLIMYKTPIYPVSSNPKGYAMIINIKKYNNDIKKERVGAEHDEKNLKNLFKQLGYKVLLHGNLTGQEMMKKLSFFAEDRRHSSVDSCILAILSHGEQVKGESTFIAADGVPITVSSVLELFSNENCEVLRRKPKIFFFQNCRGDKKVHGIRQNYLRTKTDGVAPTRLRTYSDMLIAHSTVNEYESHRDLFLGTWFIQAICKVFMQHACDTEMMELLKLVDSELETLVSEDQTMQTSCFENRGFKTFFFNPGLYDAKHV